jgi:hypothetical protein
MESKGESKAEDLLEYWSERSKDVKLCHEPPKYLKDVCSKLSSPTVSSHAGTRTKFVSTPTMPRSRSTTPARITEDHMVSTLDDSVDEIDGSWKSVHSDTSSETLDHLPRDKATTITKHMHHHKYANTPSKLYEPTAASLHGQFKRETTGMSSPTSYTPSSHNEHKDEIPPHSNVKYAHVTSKLLAPTAATIAARKVKLPLDLLATHILRRAPNLLILGGTLIHSCHYDILYIFWIFVEDKDTS